MEILTRIPHIIKYMGSKRNIIDFIIDAVDEIDPQNEKRIYDIFSGSSVVSGAFRNLRPVSSNDIQQYSSVLSKIYLQNYDWDTISDLEIQTFIDSCRTTFENTLRELEVIIPDYTSISYEDMLEMENSHRNFINKEFNGFDHVFIQRFSGTYWSLEQCAQIDSIVSVIRENFAQDHFFHNLALGSLMFSMAYCSQSTGHYAQYRDLTEDNFEDILIYRKKDILNLFEQKVYSLKEYYNGENNSEFIHEITNGDYLDAINNSEEQSIIYADPPYQFVHYSRFYHALETLVRYDYPEVRYKGRYRTDRHQSPFCIKTKVKDAFETMFTSVIRKNSILILSYSNSGMISLEDLIQLAEGLSDKYEIELKSMDYQHSTMGRQKDKYRDVKEILLVLKPI